MSLKFLIITLLLCNVAFGVYSYSFGSSVWGSTKYEWTHEAKLPSGVEVKWISQDPEFITFEMKAPTRGYVAIGFSPSGSMAGGDMFVGWVDSRGEPHLLDMYGTHNGQPVLDNEQNLELLGGKEDEAGTTIAFRRRWETCDEQDFVISDDTMRLIWAIGFSDPSEKETGYFPTYHGQDVMKRGAKSTYMRVRPKHRKFPDEEEVYPRNVKHIDITVSNISIPRTETHYFCKILKFPKLERKHHVIAYRPSIVSESFPHVHHIVVYRCQVPAGMNSGEIFEKYVDLPETDCYGASAPQEFYKYCFLLWITISVGGEGDVYPEHLGEPIGSTEEDTFYRLEIHYENPLGRQVIDSSGVRIFYSPELRQYEMMTSLVGHRITPFITVPPYQTEYDVYGFCNSECTQKAIPEGGIKIFSVLLHAHLAAKELTLRHIRNGKELPVIAQDKVYDFNYQHFRMLPKETTVLPGDEMIMECVYKSGDNDTFVFGGLSSREEMCHALVVYYPSSTFLDCRSQPEFYNFFEAIGIENATSPLFPKLNLPLNSKYLPKELQDNALFDDTMVIDSGKKDIVDHEIFRESVITKPSSLSGKDVHDYMMGLNWKNPEFAKSVARKRNTGEHYVHCSTHGGKKIRLSRDTYRMPKYEPYVDTPRKCLKATSGGIPSTSYIEIKLMLLVAAFIQVALA